MKMLLFFPLEKTKKISAKQCFVLLMLQKKENEEHNGEDKDDNEEKHDKGNETSSNDKPKASDKTNDSDKMGSSTSVTKPKDKKSGICVIF